MFFSPQAQAWPAVTLANYGDFVNITVFSNGREVYRELVKVWGIPFAAIVLRGSLENENLHDEHLNFLTVLIQGSAAHLHDALIRLRARRDNFEDFCFHVQDVAWPRRPGPRNFAAETYRPAAEPHSSGYAKAHACRGGVPAAGGEAAENAVVACHFIEVEWLRIEFRGKCLHAIRFHAIRTGDEPLADLQIVQVQSVS
jgi:hypothetical protein